MMNKFLNSIVVLIGLILIQGTNLTMQAQVMVSAKLDTSMMLIGDQTKFRMEATFPDSVLVGFPIFADTIIDKLEILNITNIDTQKVDDGLKLVQEYLVTSFDSGWYQIPPLNFTITYPKSGRVDTLQSVPTFFGVMTMPLDTANANAIADIKKPMEAPITIQEILPIAGIGLGVVIFLFVAYLLYMKLARKKPIFVKKEKPKEPAHVIALRDLDLLQEQKLWQQGEAKAYYSRLTEIIRTYIEDRFSIPAMESTTDEIIDACHKSDELSNELKNDLFDTLTLADFVKFAKAITVATENETSLKFAYNFVLKTKPAEVLRDEDELRNEGKDIENKPTLGN